MKIDILCNDGSPIGVTVKDIWGKGRRGIGVGGAELALLTMCEEWYKRGYEVTLYNNPLEANASPFEQRPINTFDRNASRDVLIVFRSPNPRAYNAKGYHVWWSCDQYTRGNFRAFGMAMEKIVTISPFHARFFAEHYGLDGERVVDIDLPVRVEDYDARSEGVERQPYKVIFTSVPDRGLRYLADMWPQLVARFPELSLTITSDYRLWGAAPLNQQHIRRWMRHKNIRYLGAIPREQLLVEQLSADVHLYPCSYEELFCISVAESSVAGTFPVSSTVGALATTNMGVRVEGHPQDAGFAERFIKAVEQLLADRERLESNRIELMDMARRRFHPGRIVEQWEEKVFKNA